eukprot:s3234_g7.t1
MPAAAENLKKVCNRSFSALTAAMMICFECDIRRILLESETSLVAVLSVINCMQLMTVINCMQLMTCWSEQSRFLAEVYALFAVAKEAYDRIRQLRGSYSNAFGFQVLDCTCKASNSCSVERQALYFQRFTVATLFVQKLIETVPDGADELAEQLNQLQKLIETVPDGADELAEQLNQLAAFMADSMCLLHMVLQPLGCMSWSCVLMHASTRILRCAP